MSDEQILYISPEDDLTSVRERLERIQQKQITLVIPSHTLLRSHVAWKLLYARARELNKEVVIVSSDPQIRSVAHAVKFKVAHSLESSAVKSRPGSRPGRSGTSHRGKTTLRSSQRSSNGEARSRSRSPQPQIDSSLYATEVEQLRHSPTPDAAHSDVPDKHYDAAHSTDVDTSPSIHPLSPEQLEEEPDLLLEDFQQAQDIRQAASGYKYATEQMTNDEPATPQSAIPPQHEQAGTPLSDIHATSISDREDDLPPPPAPMYADTPALDRYATYDYAIEDVAEIPTNVVEGKIEYPDSRSHSLSEQEPAHPISHPWVEPEPEDEQDIVGPSRTHNVRPHSSRSSGGIEKAPPQTSKKGLEAEEDQPIVELPTRVTPVTPTPSSASRSLRPTPPQRERQIRQTPHQTRPTQTRPMAQPGQRSAAARRPSPSRTTKSPSPRKSNAGRWVLIAVAIVALLGFLAYFIPSADVTLTLRSHPFTHALTLVAKSGNVPGALPAQVKTQKFSKSGTGTATGTKKVGKAAATGSVSFTNEGKTPVIVPSNTIISTANGIQFMTDAEPSLNTPGNAGNTVPVPIHAVVPGNDGNVDAGAITVIPQQSLEAIAQASNTTTADLNIKVTNENATTGGGVGNAHSVQKQDLDAVTQDLHNQVQTDIDAWLKHESQTSILGNPSTTTTLVNTPKEGQTVDDPNFPATLTVTVSVLAVSSDAMQSSAVTQLNDLMSKDKNYNADMVLTDAQHPVKFVPIHAPTGDLNTMTLLVNASAQIVPKVSLDTLRSSLAGRSISDAQAQLKQQPGVLAVSIQQSPGFISWMPFWTGHIHLSLQLAASP